MKIIETHEAASVSGAGFFEDVGRAVGYAHGWISGRIASSTAVPTGAELERYADPATYESM